jgi:hypothetical protein
VRPLHSRSEGPPASVDGQLLALQLAKACFQQVLAVNQVSGRSRAAPVAASRRLMAGAALAALPPLGRRAGSELHLGRAANCCSLRPRRSCCCCRTRAATWCCGSPAPTP